MLNTLAHIAMKVAQDNITDDLFDDLLSPPAVPQLHRDCACICFPKCVCVGGGAMQDMFFVCVAQHTSNAPPPKSKECLVQQTPPFGGYFLRT